MKLNELFEKAPKKKTLYVSRELLNGDDLVKWAKDQGFETCLEPDDFHVTIAYSKKAIDWDFTDSFDHLKLDGGDDRKMDQFGNAVVLRFDSKELKDRWKEFIDENGASYDFDEYKPHVTITYSGMPEGMKLDDIEPYDGVLKFGPEVFAEVTKNWASKTEEVKLDEGYDYEEDGVSPGQRANRLIDEVTSFANQNGVRIEFKFPAFHAPELEMTDLFADAPGGGAGTKVMDLLCKLADEYQLNVYTKPESSRNKEFYGRFGFVKSDRHFAMLIRYCQDDEELDESFRLDDVDFDTLFQTFKKSYEAETGASWSEGKLASRARGWTFYGDPSGFVAVRKQASGMKKLVAAAGDPRGVLKGLTELSAEGGPIWGAVSGPLLSAAKKRGMIAPHTMPGGPLFIKALVKAIPASVFGDISPTVAKDGGLVLDYPDVGPQTKYLIGNKEYFQEAAKIPAILALKIPGMDVFLRMLGVRKAA